MSIQYSGSAGTSTFVPTNKQDIINNVETELLAVGWTTISGHATTNLLMQSATTPQGYAIRVRLKDNSGTCVNLSIESTDGVLVGTNTTTTAGAHLNPGSGLTFRIVACAYQAFIYVTPYAGSARQFAAFGVPFVPSWIASSTTRIGWLHGNADTDTDTTLRPSFRSALTLSPGGGTDPAYQSIYNASIVSSAGVFGIGNIGLASFVTTNGNAGVGYRWETGQALVIDPIISWGTAGATVEAKHKGQLWDAIVSADSYTSDLTFAEDGHNWIVITDNNAVYPNRGTLVVATS